MAKRDTQHGNGRYRELIDAWEAQQDAYVHHRDQRFEVMVDVLEHVVPPEGTVLDLASGLGSLSRLILERLPAMHCIAVDFDPALLELARHNLAEFGDRVTIIDGNLKLPDWLQQIDRQPHAAVSSTALHWLPAPDLMALYQRLANLLPEGAVFMNADHLDQHQPESLFELLSISDDARTQNRAFDGGVPTWEQWWEQVSAVPALSELVERRHAQLHDVEEPRKASPALHIEALRVAGFREAGTLWQYLNDYVIYAQR